MHREPSTSARVATASGNNLHHNSTSPIAGAGGYRAPEVLDTWQPTLKADVYSLGVLLLELLTCKSPTHASMQDDVGGALDLPYVVGIVGGARGVDG